MSVDADRATSSPPRHREEREAWAATLAWICAAMRDCTAAERKTFGERLGRPSLFAFVRRFVDPAEASRIRRST